MTSRVSRPSSRLFRWGILLAYSAIILSTLSLVRAARDWLTGALGERGFSMSVWGLFAAAGIWFAVWAARQHVLRSRRRLAILATACAAYAVMILRLDVPVERIHYLEYGLVAVLALRAFEMATPDAGSYALACLYVMALGLVDEAMQWILPTRVGEFRDVAINLSAGLLGLLLVVAARPQPFRRVHRQSAGRVLRWSAGVLAGSAAFLTFIHGFGYRHRSSAHAEFRSVFAPGAFEDAGRLPEAVAYREFPDSPVSHPGDRPSAWVRQRILQWQKLRHPTAAAYNFEAWRHRQLRDALKNPRYAQYRESLEEERILTTFYRAYADHHELALSVGRKQQYEKLPFAEGSSYMSPTQELLITWVRPATFWAGAIMVSLGLLTAGLLLGRSPAGTRSPSRN
ncbi:MAG: VanZ family protein [Candidatus Eisenbacteria bacterium]|jgi:hypothetical protein|nr:VanZ family protein [Candidatus Eisenbacteria bacterium]